jgi:hypothetical protein
MSEYHVVDVIFKDEAMLLGSLRDMGYKPVVHEQGIQLSNSYSRSKPTAHIVVTKDQFGGCYGDVGFERNSKGFVMHADHIDIRKFNLKKLNKTYSENKVKKYVSSTSRCNITSRKENKNGQIEIKLRIQQ